MENNLISIIIPIYNAQKYLEECIKSVLKQTYENIELLLINDGSVDNSKEICNRYVELDSRIKYFEKENSGVSDTRNFGIKKSEGKWILFLDADDWLEEDACLKYSKCFKNNYDIIFSKTNLFFQNNNKLVVANYFMFSDLEANADIKEKMIASIFFESKNFFSFIETPWGKIYKKEFMIKNSLFFDNTLSMGEDGFLNFKAFNISNKLFIINDITYNYRINNESVTHKLIKDLDRKFDLLLNKYRECEFSKIYKKYEAYYVIRKFEGMLNDYFFNPNNKDAYKDKKKKILKIISMDLYKNAFSNINMNILPIKRKVLVICARIHNVFFMFLITIMFKILKGKK